MVHGNIQYSAISRFVKELPQEKLDWKEETFGGLFKKGPSMTANSLSGSLFGGSSSMSSGSSFSASQGSQTAKKTNYDNVFDLKYAKAQVQSQIALTTKKAIEFPISNLEREQCLQSKI